MKFNWETISGVIRHILTFGGGYLVAKGKIDTVTMENAVAAIITLGGVFWSYTSNKDVVKA